MNWSQRAVVAWLVACATWVHAEAPVLQQEGEVTQVAVPGVERWVMGEYEVFALSDKRFVMDAHQLSKLPQQDWGKAIGQALQRDPSFKSVNAYALKRGSAVILINAGRGARQGEGLGWVADNLKAVGISPDEVKAIFLTSMHADHVTGLVDEAEQRVFKHAQVFATTEAMAHWLADYSYVHAPDGQKLNFAATITSVMPYVKAGKLKPLDEGLALWPGMKAIPLSSGAPGGVGYLIESGGHQLMLMGDAAASVAERRKAWRLASRQKWRVADAMAPFPGDVGAPSVRKTSSYR